jgi:hypothetical protein
LHNIHVSDIAKNSLLKNTKINMELQIFFE